MSTNGDHEIVISEQTWFYAVCVCGWRGQGWDTEHGAGREGEFHLEHPVLTGEHEAVVPEEDER